MIIQQASMKYVESFCSAVDAVARERKFLAATTGFPLESTREFVKTIVEGNLAQYYALEGDLVIGWCDILPRGHEGMRHTGILAMGVLKAWRGRGIGARLLEVTIQHARQINRIERVDLEVFESNLPAVNLYKKAGFKIEGKRIKGRKLNGVYDNIILMGKFI